MRSNLTRTLAIASTLVVAGLGLSACVSDGYDPYPRTGYYSGGGGIYDGYAYRRDHDRRWDQRRWADRNHNGRPDWYDRRH
jgi:hypothetical protein